MSEIILCVYGAICVKYFNVNALGTTKQKPQLLAKKQETSLDKNETVDDDAEESDEAKESEADQDSSNGPEEQSGSSGNSDSASDQRIPRYSSSVNVCQITKASQTDPLRRYLVQTLTIMDICSNINIAKLGMKTFLLSRTISLSGWVLTVVTYC